MPQSSRLRDEFLERFGPHLAARRERVRTHFANDPAAVATFYDRIRAEMAATAAAEGADPMPTAEWPLPPVEDLLAHVEAGLQPIVDELCNEVEQRLASLGANPMGEVYVGALPTGLFNAQAVFDPGGALLLVNTGLLMLLHQVAKISGWAMWFTEYGPNNELQPHRATGRPAHTLEEIQDALADVVIAYLRNDDSTYATRHPALGGVGGAVASRLRHEAQLFVIAHEYGHVYRGHLGTGSRRLVLPDTPETLIATKSVEHEFEADRFALELMLGSHPRLNGDALFVAAAATLFFGLAELIDATRREALGVADPVDTDHPSPAARIDAAFQLFEDRLGEKSLGAARPILEFLRWHTPAVIRNVARIAPSITSMTNPFAPQSSIPTNQREREPMSKSDQNAPSFEEAATYLILPSWMPPDVAKRVLESVASTLEPEAPVVAVQAAAGERDDKAEEAAPLAAPLGRFALRYVAPLALDAATRVIRDVHNDNRTAKAHYDSSANAYLQSRDQWWDRQMGRR